MTGPVLLAGNLLDGALLGEPAGRPKQRVDTAPPITFGPAGPCPSHDTLVIGGFDNSGSVTGGNDPVGNRFEEASAALQHMCRRCRCGRELVALRTFDLRTSSDVGPLPIDRHGPKVLFDALLIPAQPAYGSSCLGPLLTDAEQLAAAHPDHQVVLAIFSDFELCDQNPSAVLDRLVRFAEKPNHQVHTIVLRSTLPAQLQNTSVVVTHVPLDSSRGIVARAVFGAFLAGREPVEEPA